MIKKIITMGVFIGSLSAITIDNKVFTYIDCKIAKSKSLTCIKSKDNMKNFLEKQMNSKTFNENDFLYVLNYAKSRGISAEEFLDEKMWSNQSLLYRMTKYNMVKPALAIREVFGSQSGNKNIVRNLNKNERQSAVFGMQNAVKPILIGTSVEAKRDKV